MSTMILEETVTEQYARELGEARNLLALAVATKGVDHVYRASAEAPNCMYLEYELDLNGDLDYRHPTGPACIVGHVLVTKGYELLRIAPLESKSARTVCETLNAFEHPTVRDALDYAQAAQDNGETWGEALNAFERHIARYERAVRMSGRPLGTDVPMPF